jgi:hypothetical protein
MLQDAIKVSFIMTTHFRSIHLFIHALRPDSLFVSIMSILGRDKPYRHVSRGLPVSSICCESCIASSDRQNGPKIIRCNAHAWFAFCGWSYIGCSTSSVAQANLTIKTNFNILRSFSSSDILTICLHTFLQSLHPFEKNWVQGLPRDFRQNNLNTNKKFRWSFSAISHQLSFDIAKNEKSEGAKYGE